MEGRTSLNPNGSVAAFSLIISLMILLGGCRCRARDGRAAVADARIAPRADAAPAAADDPAWRALDNLPRARPRWHVAVPVLDAAALTVDVHGPVVAEGIAVVAGSAIGVAGVDLTVGALFFQRPPSGRIGTPVVLDRDLLVSVGDCPYLLDPPRGAVVVGCYVVHSVRDQAVFGAGSIVASSADAAVLGAGPTSVTIVGRTIYVGREDGRLELELPDPPRGEVRATAVPRRRSPAPSTRPIVSVGTGDRQVDLWVKDDVLELWYQDPEVMSDRSAMKDFAGAPGSLGVIDDRTIRGFRLGDGVATLQPVAVHLDDLSVGNIADPLPGIQLLAAAHGARGFAMAVRLDRTLQHDYVAAFTTAGQLVWVSPLPAPPGGARTMPVGVAITDELVIVFHDGTVVAALPAP